MGTCTIQKTWNVNGVPTDPDAVPTLQDPTNAKGVIRNDTNAVVVAAGTAMTRLSAGVFSYTFSTVSGVAYTAWVNVIYNGLTYNSQIVDSPRSDVLAAMLARLNDLLQSIPAINLLYGGDNYLLAQRADLCATYAASVVFADGAGTHAVALNSTTQQWGIYIGSSAQPPTYSSASLFGVYNASPLVQLEAILGVNVSTFTEIDVEPVPPCRPSRPRILAQSSQTIPDQNAATTDTIEFLRENDE
jgi:hypothetical protein